MRDAIKVQSIIKCKLLLLAHQWIHHVSALCLITQNALAIPPEAKWDA